MRRCYINEAISIVFKGRHCRQAVGNTIETHDLGPTYRAGPGMVVVSEGGQARPTFFEHLLRNWISTAGPGFHLTPMQ